MPEPLVNLADAVATYDPTPVQDDIRQAEVERQAIQQRFPLADWPAMPLERFALGQEDSEDTFCRWLEFRSFKLGGMRGGNARKLIIYKHKDAPGWYFPSGYRDVGEAWQQVRAGFVEAFNRAQRREWDAIDDVESLRPGPALKLKALHIYFPDDILSVYSKAHIQHFLRLLRRPEGEERTDDVVRLNRALLSALQAIPALADWSTVAIMRFLYRVADPREQRRIVKIAPGEDARFWPECLAGGYICVGWDDVGDLREFESKEAFRVRFEEAFSAMYHGHRGQLTKKADEVWTLIELEPGDVVIANQGTSKILAVGEVAEAGYEWRPDRADHRHTVKVNWDTSYAKEIAPQKRWAFVTVAPVPATAYREIIGDGNKPDRKDRVVPAPVDRVSEEIATALARRGQVILYGPPGTGKTYLARRFAIWWLLRDERPADAAAALGDSQRLRQLESELATRRSARQVWWAVANPQHWSWDELFRKGRETYRYGRLQRNYPLVQVGDLVVGYQATPDRRIVALARVSKGFSAADAEKSGIEIASLARVNKGPGWDDLVADPILRTAEPMRFRNRIRARSSS